MTQIIAHRGASRLAPENTMPAFELAVQLGADAIETDVHLTKDHIPVLMHDAKVDRTTNSTGFIHTFTFAELAEFDAGSWFSPKYKQTKIIRLETLLKWAQTNSLQINLELKNNKIAYPHLEDIVCELVYYYNLQDRTTISTFNSDSIKYMATFKKPLSLAYLRSRRLQNLADYTKQIKAQSLHINYRLLTKKLIRKCEQKNLKLRVYTVNKFHQMIRCFRLGCDGIFTDIPNRALFYRKGYLLTQKRNL